MADNKSINDAAVSKLAEDPIDCKLYSMVNGLYYYYLEAQLFEAVVDNTTVLGTTDAIVNIAMAPFLNLSPEDLSKTEYNTERYGHILDQTAPMVYRIRPSGAPREMDLIEAPLYRPTYQKIGPTSIRDYRNESRLYNYPYRSIMFTSNIFDRYEVIPHLMRIQAKTANKIQLKAMSPVSPGGNFFVYVPFYKNDNGITERMYTATSMDIPNSSSAYSNYMSTQKARTAVSEGNAFRSTLGAMAAGAISGGATGAIAGNVPGALIGAGIGAVGGLISGGVNTYNTVKSNMATQQDMVTTPNSLKTMGGDIVTRIGKEGGAKVYATELIITDDYKQMLADYFHMYGYKQNKIMNVHENLETRYHFNYIKTIGCNVKGQGVPKKHLARIKSIFDNGTTLWHVHRNHVEIGDYTHENTEMKFL